MISPNNNLLDLFFFQPWEGKVLGKRRNGDSYLQNVHIIPVIGKGG